MVSLLRRRVEGGGVSRARVWLATGPGLGERRLQNVGVSGLCVTPGRARPPAKWGARQRVD